MKRQTIILLFTAFMSMISLNGFAYNIAVENADGVTIYYNYINGGKELEVTFKNDKYRSYSSSVDIPEEVTYMNRNRKVTSIGEKAFYNCNGLISVTIPKSVMSIGKAAFNGCDRLTSVLIPVADLSAFCNNKIIGLVKDYINKPVVLIDNAGKEITEYIIPNDATTIGDNAFYNCSGLTSITVGNSVTTIGDFAFYKCSGLTSITIGNRVTSIGEEAFNYCSGLTSVHISDLEAWCKIVFPKITYYPNSIGYFSNPLIYARHLFLNGEEVKNLIIPNTVTNIGNQVFFGCESLTSVTIPNSVTSIGSHAFAACKNLTSVTIGNNVKSIEDYAFSNCNGLTSVTIPNSVTSIGNHAFSSCSGLTSITIGNGVISICNRAFGFCTGLTSITIPNSVTSIEDEAFFGCDILEVISKIEDPFTIGTNTFSENTFYNATLYVPIGTITKYKAKWAWSRFVFIEEDNGGTFVIQGDANGDGIVNTDDIVTIAEYIMALYPEDFNEKAADANEDGKVNVADIVKIINIMNKKK